MNNEENLATLKKVLLDNYRLYKIAEVSFKFPSGRITHKVKYNTKTHVFELEPYYYREDKPVCMMLIDVLKIGVNLEDYLRPKGFLIYPHDVFLLKVLSLPNNKQTYAYIEGFEAGFQSYTVDSTLFNTEPKNKPETFYEGLELGNKFKRYIKKEPRIKVLDK